MTDKEKLEKIKELADAMYYAAQQLTTDASRLHKAMDEYRKFIINEYHKEEPVSEDLDIAIGEYCSNPDNFITYIDVAFAYRSEQKDDIPLIIKAIKFGANWQNEQIIKRLCNHANIDQMVEKFEDKYKPKKVLDTEYYKRGIFDTIKAIKEE